MFIRRRRKKSDIPDGTTAKQYKSNILYESTQSKGPQKSFTVTENPQNFENRRISETKDQHIYHEIESKEDKIAISGRADRISSGVESKEVDVLTEKEAHTRPSVNEKTETASRKSQSGTESQGGAESTKKSQGGIESTKKSQGGTESTKKSQSGTQSTKSTVVSTNDNKQSTVKGTATAPERREEPEVKQNTDSPAVVSGDNKQKADDIIIPQPNTKKIEDTLKTTEDTGINIPVYDNRTESKPTPSTVVRPGAEKPVNKKNVSVIQVCKF